VEIIEISRQFHDLGSDDRLYSLVFLPFFSLSSFKASSF
jgi:hypothetical protein